MLRHQLPSPGNSPNRATSPVPAWTAIAVATATIANIVGLSANSVPITIASFALLLAAFGRIAVIVCSSPAWPQPDTTVTTRPAVSALPTRS